MALSQTGGPAEFTFPSAPAKCGWRPGHTSRRTTTGPTSGSINKRPVQLEAGIKLLFDKRTGDDSIGPMKIPATLFLLAALTLSLPVHAAPASPESVEQLLKLMQVDKLMSATFDQMNGVMKTAMQQVTKGKPLSADEQAIVDKQQQKMIAILKEEMSWDKLKDDYVRIYQGTFSQEEIDSLLAFYKSPACQAYVSKQPELMKRSMLIMQQRMGPMMQRIQAMTEETARELQQAKVQTNSPAK